MKRLDGNWYKAGQSDKHLATLEITGEHYRLLVHQGNNAAQTLERQGNVGALKPESPVGTSVRQIGFDDGALFESTDTAGVDDWLKSRQGWMRPGWGLHRLESSWRLAIIGLAVTVIASYAMMRHGVPAIASFAANRVPVSLSETLSRHTMSTLDGAVFDPTEISDTEQRHWRARFSRLLSELPPDEFHYTLHFRSMQGIANAFALPGGDIVISDALLNLTDNPTEIEAVLLHEIGHVRKRHGLQNAMAAGSMSFAVAMAIGNTSVMGDLVTTVPLVLLQSGYSRQSETEADEFALQTMLNTNRNTVHFANFMRKLNSSSATETPSDTSSEEDEQHGVLDYFSSHPGTGSRIKRALELSVTRDSEDLQQGSETDTGS